MRRKLIWGVVVVALGAAAAFGAYLGRFEIYRRSLELPPFSHAAGETLVERLPMRDGVRLFTRVRLPAGDGPWPILLIRNPYPRLEVMDSVCQVFVRYGYGCVLQDVRGRKRSEGEWEPLVNERADGLDTLDWLVEQRFQDGSIALYGPSYLAFVQWAVADALPPEVKTIVPMVFGTDFYGNGYDGGMFRHEILTAWAAIMTPSGERKPDAYQEALRHRPHTEVDTLHFGESMPWYRRWVASPSPADPLWQNEDLLTLRAAPERIDVPVLAISGWYDAFLDGQLDDFERLATRERSRLVLGPWTHGLRADGDVDYPADDGMTRQWIRTLDWFDHHLRGAPLRQPASGVEIYTLGEDRWRQLDDWPPATVPRRLYLDAGVEGPPCAEGRLVGSAPSEAVAEWSYDPDDPVPTRGGSALLTFLLSDFESAPPGAVRQEGLCERPDVVSFVGEPLAHDLRVAGPIELSLVVDSDADDTAFTAKLVEIDAEGVAVHVRDAIVSLAYREPDGPHPYVAGERVPLRLTMSPIDWRVPAGHRLRLDVSSSNFPAYHAHTNRFGPWAEQSEAVVAHQRLFTGGAGVSWVELPIVAEGD